MRLMKKHGEYFSGDAWQRKYEFERATDISDEDLDFLLGDPDEFWDRCIAVKWKKNMCLEGFVGRVGMHWTGTAINDAVFGRVFERIREKFEDLHKSGRSASEILEGIRGRYSAYVVHDALIDHLECERPDENIRKQIGEMMTILHTRDNLPSCKNTRCVWFRQTRCAAKPSLLAGGVR